MAVALGVALLLCSLAFAFAVPAVRPTTATVPLTSALEVASSVHPLLGQTTRQLPRPALTARVVTPVPTRTAIEKSVFVNVGQTKN